MGRKGEIGSLEGGGGGRGCLEGKGGRISLTEEGGKR